jgi:preprotein translocase subunit SecD
VTGDEMTSASSGFDQQSAQPAVFVNLDSKGARRMRNVTTDNVGKPMAVVFKEKRTVDRDADGRPIKRWVEEVINVATIREPFGRRFQTTGLDSPQEAHQLALLLRAGALAAPSRSSRNGPLARASARTTSTRASPPSSSACAWFWSSWRSITRPSAWSRTSHWSPTWC